MYKDWAIIMQRYCWTLLAAKLGLDISWSFSRLWCPVSKIQNTKYRYKNKIPYCSTLLVAKSGRDIRLSFSHLWGGPPANPNTKYTHKIQNTNTNSKYKIHCSKIRPGHKPIIQLAVMGASCKSTADNIQGQRDFKISPHVGQINLKQSLHDGQINISNKQRSISLNLQAQILKLPDWCQC